MANGHDQDSTIIALAEWRAMPADQRDHFMYMALRGLQDKVACIPAMQAEQTRQQTQRETLRNVLLTANAVLGLLVALHALGVIS